MYSGGFEGEAVRAVAPPPAGEEFFFNKPSLPV